MADSRGLNTVALNAKVTLPDGKSMTKSDLMKMISVPPASADIWLHSCVCADKCTTIDKMDFNANSILPTGITVAEAAQLLKAGIVKDSAFPADQLKAIRSV